HATAAHQIDDREQDDRTDESPQEAIGLEGAGLGAAHEHAVKKSALKSTHDADDDIEEDALLRVGAHDDARQPADDAADDKRDDDTHIFCSHFWTGAMGRTGASW